MTRGLRRERATCGSWYSSRAMLASSSAHRTMDRSARLAVLARRELRFRRDTVLECDSDRLRTTSNRQPERPIQCTRDTKSRRADQSQRERQRGFPDEADRGILQCLRELHRWSCDRICRHCFDWCRDNERNVGYVA